MMTDASDTESDLLRRVKDGDERALVVLFARHNDRLSLCRVGTAHHRRPSFRTVKEAAPGRDSFIMPRPTPGDNGSRPGLCQNPAPARPGTDGDRRGDQPGGNEPALGQCSFFG
jgi:hypothetical protein